MLRSLSALFQNSFRTLECQNGRKRNSTPNWRFKTSTKLNFSTTICPNWLFLGWMLQFHFKLLKIGSDFLKNLLHSKLKACTPIPSKRYIIDVPFYVFPYPILRSIDILILVYSYQVLIKFLQFFDQIMIRYWWNFVQILFKIRPDFYWIQIDICISKGPQIICVSFPPFSMYSAPCRSNSDKISTKL